MLLCRAFNIFQVTSTSTSLFTGGTFH